MITEVKHRPYAFHSSPLTNNRGMALVLTLLIVAIITAMVVEFAYSVYVHTSALHNWRTSQELSLAAKSATRLAPKLISPNPRDSYTSGFLEISQASPLTDLQGTITLRIEDENAKFNLNALGHWYAGSEDKSPYNSFRRLLAALELDPKIADRIWDWIDSDNEPRLPDSENGAKNANLDSVDELLLIPGIDRESYEKLRPYVTIYSSDKRININSASVPVLMSLSDSIQKEMAERVVKYRESAPFESAGEISNVAGFEGQLATSLTGYTTTTGTAYRVIATAQSGDIKRIIESVLDGNRVAKYWKEM